MVSILDRILRAPAWRGVRKDLRKSSIFIRNECVPKVILLLKIYHYIFGFQVDNWWGEAGPGRYDIILIGKFPNTILEIGKILEKLFPTFRTYVWFKEGFKEGTTILTLMISHPDGYKFNSGDEI